MFKFEVKGLRELERSLQRLQNRAQSLQGTNRVAIRDILTDAFMQKHTRYRSIDDWFAASPFKIDSQGDFEGIPDAEWDAHVRATTSFASWQEMLGKAGAAFFEKKLFT